MKYIHDFKEHKIIKGSFLCCAITVCVYLAQLWLQNSYYLTSNDRIIRIARCFVFVLLSGVILWSAISNIKDCIISFKSAVICKPDFIFLYSSICLVTYVVCLLIDSYSLFVSSVRLQVALALWIIIQLCWLVRVFIYNDNDLKVKDIITLKKVCDKEFMQSFEGPFVVDCAPTCEDLFSRDYLVEQIEKALMNNRTPSNFVLGLDGDWGTGKTSLLNSVRTKLDKNEFEWIEFSAWKYPNLQSLIEAFYNALISHTDIASSHKAKEYLRYVKNAFATSDSKLLKVTSHLLADRDEDDEELLKSFINNALRASHKRYIVVIDDFDRALSEGQRFLLPLLNGLFCFDNCTYILAYDKRRVINSFRTDEEKYIDKIINCEIKIPELTKEQRYQVCRRCLENTLMHYLGIKDFEDLEFCFEYALNKIANIRDLVLLINSLQDLSLFKTSVLYLPDVVAIVFLRSLNPYMFKEIQTHKYYFITTYSYYKTVFDKNYKMTYVGKEQGQAYFDLIFTPDNEFELLLLSNMFDYANQFSVLREYPEEYAGHREKYLDEQARIDSNYFFDGFFAYLSGDVVKAKYKIKEVKHQLKDYSFIILIWFVIK